MSLLCLLKGILLLPSQFIAENLHRLNWLNPIPEGSVGTAGEFLALRFRILD